MRWPDRARVWINLVRKDAVAARNLGWFYAGLYLVMVPLLAFAIGDSVLLEYMPALWVIGLLAVENRSKPDGFVCSLPLRRSDIVTGKYLWAIIVITAGLTLVFLSARIQYAIDPRRFSEWVYINNGWAVLYCLIPNLLPICIAFPLSFRFGPIAGMAAGYASIVLYLPFLIGIERVLVSLQQNLGRLLTVLDDQTGPLGYNTFLIEKMARDSNPVLFVCIYVLTLGVLVSASAGLSQLGYRRREIT